MNSYVDRILHDSGGYTGNTYYIRILRRDGYVWDSNAGVFAAHSLVSWANSAILLIENGSSGDYPVVIPKDFPAGIYDIIVYLQAGGSPANTDDISKQWETKVGDIFGF